MRFLETDRHSTVECLSVWSGLVGTVVLTIIYIYNHHGRNSSSSSSSSPEAIFVEPPPGQRQSTRRWPTLQLLKSSQITFRKRNASMGVSEFSHIHTNNFEIKCGPRNVSHALIRHMVTSLSYCLGFPYWHNQLGRILKICMEYCDIFSLIILQRTSPENLVDTTSVLNMVTVGTSVALWETQFHID